MMDKNCIQCGSRFLVRQEDVSFYESVSPVFNDRKYLIPVPSHCFGCRLIRKLAWRNECQLYKRKSDLTGKTIVSMYSPDKPYKVYESELWNRDEVDLMKYGVEVKSDRSIIDQFRDFYLQIPHQHLMNFGTTENCDYSNFVLDSKNLYLCFWGDYSEDSFYNYGFNYLRNCIDNYWLLGGELCYDCIHSSKCHHSKYVRYSENISDSSFIFNCKDLQYCFGCVHLQHKSYCIFNQQYSKDEYFEKLKQYDLGSYSTVQGLQREFEVFRLKYPVKALEITGCENVIGNSLFNSKNCFSCFELYNGEGCAYSVDAQNAVSCYDIYGSLSPSFTYESFAILGGRNVLFSFDVFDSSDVLYSRSCRNCDHIFGCLGLRHKKYCIFNKQYSPDEYERLVSMIIDSMRGDGGIWGEFLPVSLSPFGYNETPAQEIYPKTRDQALNEGFNWSDFVIPDPFVEKSLKVSDIPDNIRDVSDSILDCGIECEVTQRSFKIIRQELDFYRNHDVPLPRRHYDQRRLDRIFLSYPRKLYQNSCRKCEKQVYTCFDRSRPEMVYCEECYLAEIY